MYANLLPTETLFKTWGAGGHARSLFYCPSLSGLVAVFVTPRFSCYYLTAL